MKYIPVLAISVASGCGVLSSEPDSPNVQVEVNASTLEIDPSVGSVMVPFTVRNTAGADVYLDRCGDRISTLVERRENGRWVHFLSDGCPAVFDMSPLLLEVGAQRSSFRILRDRGQYRLRIGVLANLRQASYSWSNVSQPFVVN